MIHTSFQELVVWLFPVWAENAQVHGQNHVAMKSEQ